MKELSKEVDAANLFRSAVFGDNATINIGSGTISGVTSSVVHNDFDSLSALLKSSGLRDGDISDLRTAIEEDRKALGPNSRELGPRVRSWIGSMVSKAGTAAWSIGIGAAAGLLSRALAAYYGIGA